MWPIENCSGVYAIINDENGHCYVGSSYNVLKRVWAHLRRRKGSAIVASAIQKYGVDHFHSFLLEAAQRSDLPTREARWIALWHPEYNASELTDTGGKIISAEQRDKISARLRGRKLSNQHRMAISASLLGHVTSAETRALLAAAKRGFKHHPDSIQKMRDAWKIHQPARIAKMSAAGIGRIVSTETRAKKSAALKGKPWSKARRRAADLGFVDKHYKL